MCQYFTTEKSEAISSKASKEFPLNSESINFENDTIKFDNIDISKGIIYFFFVINKSVIEEKNTEVPTYNRLFLKDVGIREKPIDLFFLVGNYTTFNVTIKIGNIAGAKAVKKDANENNNISNNQKTDSKSNKLVEGKENNKNDLKGKQNDNKKEENQKLEKKKCCTRRAC